ncbi:hypothetical protein GXW83_16900 [Streptacidiphilus sp. PB12-B1b]|uniref:zf-HC2 domain-containing protein n=1 Tax=Streptacidiphilus sp. PB12-B1b TaxID=2705012 RepID=UPI0015FA6CE2|nr:zf-HC2 domain-containing protein [Streptacidiphilus sp. PB12-B1b]QMU77137.1 hypothetical protein GXW83_16900 [Streptacidiphilus sp. PB12-B1b]
MLTGAFALHALTRAERARLRRHLAACRACAQEVGEFAETAARLGVAAALPAPPELRRQVLARIATAPRSSAAARPAAPPRPGRRTSVRVNLAARVHPPRGCDLG